MEAMPPTLGGSRSNKLKEGSTEGQGIQATGGGLGAGLKDSQDLYELGGGVVVVRNHCFLNLFMKQQVMVPRTVAPVTRATAAPTSRGTNRVSRACV